MRVGGQRRKAPAALPPGKETRYALYRRLGGPLGRSGQVRKISPPPGFDFRTVQPVAVTKPTELSRPTVNQYGAYLKLKAKFQAKILPRCYALSLQ
jgi:hypothetical protein